MLERYLRTPATAGYKKIAEFGTRKEMASMPFTLLEKAGPSLGICDFNHPKSVAAIKRW